MSNPSFTFNPPLVSVLIPVFNRVSFIADCINSALEQEFDDFEIIVVDNASEDGTWEICQYFSRLDPRVRIFRNEFNVGPVLNWIRCAEQARGMFSKFLFSDDLLEQGCLSKMYYSLVNSQFGLVFSGARIGAQTSSSRLAYVNIGVKTMTANSFLDLVLGCNAPFSPGAVMLRTADVIRNLYSSFPTSTPQAFDRNGAGPDVLLLLYTAFQYGMVAHIDCSLVFFRVHPESFSVANQDRLITAGYRSSLSYFLVQSGRLSSWRRYIAREWLSDFVRLRTRIFIGDFARQYEGCGAISEQIVLFYEIAMHFLFHLTRRKRTFIS